MKLPNMSKCFMTQKDIVTIWHAKLGIHINSIAPTLQYAHTCVQTTIDDLFMYQNT